MANITIYLPDAVEKKVCNAAKASNQPMGRWIVEQLLRAVENGWPKEFLDAAGSDPEFPEVHSLRGGYGQESPRDEFK